MSVGVKWFSSVRQLFSLKKGPIWYRLLIASIENFKYSFYMRHCTRTRTPINQIYSFVTNSSAKKTRLIVIYTKVWNNTLKLIAINWLFRKTKRKLSRQQMSRQQKPNHRLSFSKSISLPTALNNLGELLHLKPTRLQAIWLFTKTTDVSFLKHYFFIGLFYWTYFFLLFRQHLLRKVILEPPIFDFITALGHFIAYCKHALNYRQYKLILFYISRF